MTNLRIRDILDLVASKVPEPEARLEKVFECAHTRHLEFVKWLLALAAALYAAIAVALFKPDGVAKAATALAAASDQGTHNSPLWIVVAVSLASAVALAGVIMLVRGKRMYVQYLAAQALLGEISKIAPFIERYRGEIPN